MRTYLIILYLNTISVTVGPLPYDLAGCARALTLITKAKDADIVEYEKVTPICVRREQRPEIGTEYIKQPGDVNKG